MAFESAILFFQYFFDPVSLIESIIDDESQIRDLADPDPLGQFALDVTLGSS